jgi:hypothetical protein
MPYPCWQRRRPPANTLDDQADGVVERKLIYSSRRPFHR